MFQQPIGVQQQNDAHFHTLKCQAGGEQKVCVDSPGGTHQMSPSSQLLFAKCSKFSLTARTSDKWMHEELLRTGSFLWIDIKRSC